MRKLLMAVVLVLSVTNLYANSGRYYPPERLTCYGQSGHFSLKCEGFDRLLLTEDVSNAVFKKGQSDTFHFVSAVAYFAQNMSQASVYYTYKNSHSKMVKLRTTNVMIKPDLKQGNWKKFRDDLYVCNAGYMRCPITI